MIEAKTGTKLGDRASVRYESLRFQVLGENGVHRKGSLGLALFIRQGMLAWIEALHKCAPASFSEDERTNPRSIHGYKTQSEMTKVLANITLFNLGEYLTLENQSHENTINGAESDGRSP